jgi:hypothetical protein
MVKVKVPRKIKIGSYEYDVVFKPHLKTDDNLMGFMNKRTSKIELDPDDGSTLDTTLLHEVVHLISFNYEVNLDEDNTSRIANGIAELLQILGIELDWGDIK